MRRGDSGATSPRRSPTGVRKSAQRARTIPPEVRKSEVASSNRIKAVSSRGTTKTFANVSMVQGSPGASVSSSAADAAACANGASKLPGGDQTPPPAKASGSSTGRGSGLSCPSPSGCPVPCPCSSPCPGPCPSRRPSEGPRLRGPFRFPSRRRTDDSRPCVRFWVYRT